MRSRSSGLSSAEFNITSIFESLEERVLFDGVPDATFILPQTDASQPIPAQVQNVQQADIDGPRELILIDAEVENSQELLAEVLKANPSSTLDLRLLNSGSDGVEQISSILAQAEGKYDAIHIISHGDQGQVFLGNTALTFDNLNRYVNQLAGWSNALTADADLLFYGCDLAGSEQGQSLLDSISAITGADVAASNDVTGAADLGGDWELEFTTGVITTEVLYAYSYADTLALSDSTLSIVSDGSPTWDGDNNAGNDMDGSNGIIRSHDSIIMEVFYNTDSAGATDLNFTSTLPDGLVWDLLPAAAALDSRSMIVDSVTGLAGGDMRRIIAYLPDVSGTFTSSVNFEARALGGAQGTALNGVTFEVDSNENATPITTDIYDFTLSSAAHMDIRLLSPTFRGVFTDAGGTVDGVVYTYSIGILGDHPTRTGSDAVKGSAPIEDNFTFDLDFTNVSPGATIFDWGATLGANSDNADDGITRNYERFTNIAGVEETAWSHSSRPAGQTLEHPTSAAWSEPRSTPDSGDWTITGSTGSVFSAQVSGADTTGSHFPSFTAGNAVLPAGDKWFTSSQVSVWIPLSDILPGEDGIEGNLDDGRLEIIPEITNFDPNDAYGITSNFGAGTEDTSNNSYTHTVLAFNQGGGSKYNSQAGHPTSGRWVDTATVWNAGDAETSVGHIYDARVSGGRNGGVLALDGLIFGDKFDNTATKITTNSLPAQSGDGWSRVYVSGGPTNGTFLNYGTDYIIEFGTGGVGAAAGGWTDWDSMGDATLADGESIGGYWSQDPTDVLLGGNAYADGVRDSITKWRIKVLIDIEPGATMIGLVSMETIGHSTLEVGSGVNPGGNIIANFHASSIGYLREDANPANDWRGSEYDPLNNSVYSGSASGTTSGDRLWIVDANVDVDKTVVDLGAGNNYLAGSAATIQLNGTVTIPGPDSGSPAQDVYITDMLPAGLTVVGGSAQPAAGTTFVAGDGSTISVQAIEYYDPGTASWSTTWTYGSTGIRWYYGDVPLNTALPTMTFDVLIPYDAMNGESWTNTAVASSPSDDTSEEFRSSSAGIVAVQIAAMSAGKQVVTPLVPEDTTIIYDLGIANVSDDKDVPWFDLVDILPYDADFEGSSINGLYTYVDVTALDPNLEVYVTSTLASILDSQDGTVDGYADPGTPTDLWYVAEGAGIWQYSLDDVKTGVVGAPTMSEITAIRVASDKAIDPFLGPGESSNFLLHLTPSGNVGIPSDFYTNKFAARTDPASLPLPVTSAAVTAVVVAPDIEIQKEVAFDETHVNIDPTDDSHWGETVNFDDTDKAYFRLKVTNTGTADFLDATVMDSLPAGATFVAGTAAASSGDFTGFPATWTFDLAAGDSAYLIYQLDVNDAGNYVNTADVTATDAWGEVVNDSDDAEANFVTEISAAKQQTGAVRSATNPDVFEVTYEVEILNSSLFDLANLTLTENLLGAFGPGFMGMLTQPAITSSSLTGAAVAPTTNINFDGNADDQILNADGFLETGNSVTLSYTVLVDPLLLSDPANTVNQVEAGGVTGGAGGTPTTDLSDDGSDPATDNSGSRGDDGAGGTDDPTPLALPSIDLTKQIVGTAPAQSGINGNFDVTYEFMLTNTGTTDLNNISVMEDFLANLGGAFQGIVSGPLVTMTTATDNPDFNPIYDGGTGDADVFANTPIQTMFVFGGNNTSTTIGMTSSASDQFFVIDPNQTYTLSADAFAGDGAGGNYDPTSRNYIGFASYDIDGNLISTYHYAKYAAAVDTTLAVALNPGDTTITLNDATGWQNAGVNHQRSLAWYGYTDSTGHTYPDYTYTRNYLANAWAPGAVVGNTITLNTPWAGPALAAGDAVRNNSSGGSYQYALMSNGHIDETGGSYSSDIGGGFIANGAGGTTMWRPGTHSIKPLVLADWRFGGTGTQINASNFQLDAANLNLMEPGQKVTFQITVEIDPDAPGANYDEITGDGNNTLENQASVTAEDPWNNVPVADTSDDPTDPTDAEYGSDSDPDDPTSLAIPSIELTKELVGLPVAASSGTFGNFDATYEFTITNNGNDDLQMLSLLEDFATQFGGAFIAIVPQGGATALVTATNATDAVELNSGYNGNTDTELFDNTSANTNLLEMGQSITLQVIVEVDPDAATAIFTSGQLLNIATISGTGIESGFRVDDESDDANQTDNVDPDGDNSPDDPTPLYIPSISLTKDAGDAVANGDNWDVTFTKIIKNSGTVTLTNLQLIDDIAAQFGNAYSSVSGLSVQNFVGTGTAPTANTAWTGDTTLDMLNGGIIDMGDTFEVVFTVTIDPDGLDSVSQALENTSTVTGDALDEDGNPLLDDWGNQITVADVSDNGVDPDSENGEDNGDGTVGNDPTPVVIADIGVAKQVVGQPILLTNGNFEATYQLVVENTGTVDLTNLSLLEDIATQFGAPFVNAYGLALTTTPGAASTVTLDTANWDGDGASEIVNQTVPSLLAVGDFFVFEFKVEIDPDVGGSASAPLENQVTAGGTAIDSSGTPYTDSSGNPILASDDSDSGTDPSTDNASDLGDHGTSDDPTPIYIPSISLAKQAGVAVANGDNWDVMFSFFVENTGTVDLNAMTLFDDIDTEFGNAFVSASSLMVQNFSGSGTAPGPNNAWESDTTQDMLDGTGQLNAGDAFEVIFTVTIDPDGIDSVSQMLENQGTVGGDALDENGNPILDGSLPVQTFDDSDNGTDPNGENGEADTDGVFGNDPTPVVIADISVAKEVFGTPMQLANDNFSVTYQMIVENTGTVDLADLTLLDDIATQFGGTYVDAGNLTLITAPSGSSSITLDTANWDGDATPEMISQTVPTLLVVGDWFIVQFNVEVDPDATGTSGPMNNQATATGEAVDSSGNPITAPSGITIVANDDSDSGTDPSNSNTGEPGDSGSTDDPTPLLLPAIGVGKQANTVTIPTDGAGNELNGSFDIQYLVVVENTGTVELTNLQIIDDLTLLAQFGDAYDPTVLTGATDRSGLVVGPAIVSHTLTNPSDLPTLNASFLGGGTQTELFDGVTGTLQTGEQIVVSFKVRIDATELQDMEPTTDGVGANQVTGTADSSEGSVADDSDNGLNPNTDNGNGPGTDDFTPFEVPQIRLWKSHSDAVANADGTSTITVELRVQNSGTVSLSNLTLLEDLETQFGAAFISATDPIISSPPTDAASNIPSALLDQAWNDDTSLDMFSNAETTEILAAGDQFTISFDVIVDPDLFDEDSEYLENNATVTGSGLNFDSTVINVMDESGTDNGTGIDVDEPTSAIVPEIAIAKAAGDAVANGDNWDVSFTLFVENTGSVDLDMLTLFDDITAEFGNAYLGVTGLIVQNFAGSGISPTANTAWMDDTSLTMISGGHVDPGDNFEVVFTVTLDPDGVDSMSNELNNQANVGGRGVDQLGNPLTDSSGNELLTSDDSDSGTSPQGTNDGVDGDTGTDADPTPIIIADVSIAKEVVGTPTILSNGNFEVVYQLVIENIGTVNLADVSLVDDLQTQFGPAVFQSVNALTMITPPADSASSIILDAMNWDGTALTNMVDQSITTNHLVVGDLFTIQFTVEVDATAATGILNNQATVGGTAVDNSGVPYTDSSGNNITTTDDSDSGATTGEDNASAPGDDGLGGTDDPTPLYIPNIGLAKRAGDAVANGDNWDVTFTLVWENTGTVGLTNLTMLDDIATQFGNAYVGIAGLGIQNFAGTGTAPTANAAWMGDTSLSMISGGTGNVDDTFEVVFTVTIDPDGIDDVSQVLENQATTSGEALDENGAPLQDGSGNLVTANDASDNGTNATDENSEADSDGTFGNDPTPILIADISVVKAVSGIPVALNNGNFEVDYQLVIENIGTVDLAGLSLVEDMSTHFGSVFQNAGNLTLATGTTNPASNIALDLFNWDGATATEMIDQAIATRLAIGDSFVVTFTVEVDPNAVGAPIVLENQVVVTGDAVDSSGNPVVDSTGTQLTTSDDSDDGTDPNGDNPNAQGHNGTSDDPTPLLIPDVGISKAAGDAIANGDDWDVTFTIVYENTGIVAVGGLELYDDIAAQFGNGFVSASNISTQNFAGTGTMPTANAAWTGDTTLNMLTDGLLDVGDSFEVVFTVTIDPDGVDDPSQILNNQATATANGINPDGTTMIDGSGHPVTANDDSDNGTDPADENGEDDGDGIFGNDPTPILIADLAIAKSIVGEPLLTDIGNFVVTYQLVIENTGTLDLANLSLLEDISTQFGSAFVDAGNLVLGSSPGNPTSTVTLDSAGWNGSSVVEMMDATTTSLLMTGDSFTIQFDVEIDPNEVSSPLANSVDGSGDGVDSNGDPILDSNGDPIVAYDVSDSGTDPGSGNSGDPDDQGTSDDPTLFNPSEVPLGEISGTVFQDDNGDGIQQSGEGGIAGVEIALTGTDVHGNPVEVTVYTDSAGGYAFVGLNAGSYTITQTQPDGYTDGQENGNAGFTIGDDVMSNIQLGWGQAFASNTFAERPSGASGNPPRLPGLPAMSGAQISNLLSGYLGAPGPIYSGVPINGNANPLSFESGRAIGGGYSADDNAGDCGCAEPINTCCASVDACGNPIISFLFEPGIDEGCGPVSLPEQVPTEILIEGQLMENTLDTNKDREADDATSENDTEESAVAKSNSLRQSEFSEAVCKLVDDPKSKSVVAPPLSNRALLFRLGIKLGSVSPVFWSRQFFIFVRVRGRMIAKVFLVLDFAVLFWIGHVFCSRF